MMDNIINVVREFGINYWKNVYKNWDKFKKKYKSKMHPESLINMENELNW